MTSPNTPDPVTLAKIAAQLNPQLACDNPAKAIELARNLLLAADPELAKQEADRAEEMELQKEGQRLDELFLHGQMSIADAFKASPGDYKTESGFAAALRKKKLTLVLADGSEITTPAARDKLFRLQHEAKQERERARKAASKTKSQKNVAESKGQKAEQIRRKAEPQNKKAEATKQKAEVSESA